jgi:hypothetical protein
MTKVKTIRGIEGENLVLTLVILIGNEDITTCNQDYFCNKYDTNKVHNKFPIIYQLLAYIDSNTKLPFLQKQNITKPANLIRLSQLCQYYSNFLKNVKKSNSL